MSQPVTPSSRETSTPSPHAGLFRRRSISIAEQVEAFDLPEQKLTVDDLPRILIQGKKYVLEKWVRRPANARRYSWVGDHGLYLVEMKENQRGSTFWSCSECDRKGRRQLYDTGTTSNAERHLSAKHGIKRPGLEMSTSPSCNVMAMQVLGAKRRKLDDVPTTTDANILFKRTLVRWVVDANIPLNGVEACGFRRLVEVCSLGSNNILNLVPTGDTLRTWIMHEYGQNKEDIRDHLHSCARSKIHLSFDMWTSEGNIMSLMAVVAHYLDKDFNNRTVLIALRRLFGPHSGANMAETLLDVFDEFDIRDRLGYFMTDNAESNDTCLKCVMRKVDPNFTDDAISERRLRCWGHVLNLVARSFLFGCDADAFELEDATNVALDREHERLSAWRKRGPVGKLQNITTFIRASPQRRELFKSISLAAIEDVEHGLISPESKILGVVRDNATRWNSTYMMIQRALGKRQEIDAFVQVLDVRKGEAGLPQEDRLSREDWLVLEKSAEILKPIYDHTIRFQSRAQQGHHGAIWEVLPSMEMILQHLEGLKEEYTASGLLDISNAPSSREDTDVDSSAEESVAGARPQSEATIAQNTRRVAQRRPVGYVPPSRRCGPYHSSPVDVLRSPFVSSPSSDPKETGNGILTGASRHHLRTSINNAWSKLEKYYNRTDRSRAYFGSVRMHPALNEAWFTQHWKDDDQLEWLDAAEHSLRKHYDEHYHRPDDTASPTGPAQLDSAPYEPDGWDDFLAPASLRAQSPMVDEYDRFKSLNPIRDAFRKPLEWWRDHIDEYPTMSQMALDFFSVPAMSAECERVFSLAKMILSTQRQSMTASTLEYLVCLRFWWKNEPLNNPERV